LALEPLRSQPLIPLTFGLDNDDEANLESELRAMLRNSNTTNTNNTIDINNKYDNTSKSTLPPLKKDYNSNINSRVKITKGTLLRSLSLTAPINSDNNSMVVNGHIPKVKKNVSNYVNTTLKPLTSSLVSPSLVSSSSSSQRILKSDITINTTSSQAFNDVLQNMSARASFSSISSDVKSINKEESYASTDMKVEIKKKKDMTTEKNDNDNDNTNTDIDANNSNKKIKKKKKIKKNHK